MEGILIISAQIWGYFGKSSHVFVDTDFFVVEQLLMTLNKAEVVECRPAVCADLPVSAQRNSFIPLGVQVCLGLGNNRALSFSLEPEQISHKRAYFSSFYHPCTNKDYFN